MKTLKKATNILLEIKSIKENYFLDRYTNDTLNNYYDDITKMLYLNTLNSLTVNEIQKNFNKLKKEMELEKNETI